MPATTLREKLEAAIGTDTPTGYEWAIENVGKEPAPARPLGSLTVRELDLRDWGLFYGVAYGIARGEDPYETNHSVAARAFEAAKSLFREQSRADVFHEDEPEPVAA